MPVAERIERHVPTVEVRRSNRLRRATNVSTAEKAAAAEGRTEEEQALLEANQHQPCSPERWCTADPGLGGPIHPLVPSWHPSSGTGWNRDEGAFENRWQSLVQCARLQSGISSVQIRDDSPKRKCEHLHIVKSRPTAFPDESKTCRALA